MKTTYFPVVLVGLAILATVFVVYMVQKTTPEYNDGQGTAINSPENEEVENGDTEPLDEETDSDLPDAETPNEPYVLVTIVSEGGLCASGSVCKTETSIRSDGFYEHTGNSTQGILPKSMITKLTAEIEAFNFEKLSNTPFTGTCPIAYDGQEKHYTFQTTSGTEKVSDCSVAVDENVAPFSTIKNIIEMMSS